jgi:hypothetical protein
VPEPSRTSLTEGTARTGVPLPEERPEPRSRDPLSQPRAAAPRQRATSLGPPPDDEVTVPQASAARRGRATPPVPARDTAEDSVTSPQAAYGRPTTPDTHPFRDDDDEAAELTLPGMRLPLPRAKADAQSDAEPMTDVRPALKPAPARRGKAGLYVGGAVALVLLLVALVVLRLDGGLISSELPTLSELRTSSHYNPGGLQPLPAPMGEAQSAPPPLDRPLNQAKDPVPGAAQPTAQAAPPASPPAAPAPAPSEDELLAPLDPAQPAAPGAGKPETKVAEGQAPAAPAEDSRTTPPKRTRTLPKKSPRAAASPSEDPGSDTGPAQATGEPGQLTLVIEPYAKVYLGGRLLGETPLFKVSLPAGRHGLRLVGPDGQARRLSVEIKPGDTTSLRMPLELLARE